MGTRVVHTALRICFFVALLAAMVLWARPGPGLYGPREAGAAFPGANGKIAFASDRDGDYEIYVMNADGSGQTQLTTNTAVDRYPAWSADGSKIAFNSNRDGNDEIYVMNADGSSQTRLTNNVAGDQNPVWSPDGSQIAFESLRDGNWEVYKMNAGGSGQTNLTNNAAYDYAPAWSPDGSKIAFASNRDGDFEIFKMNAAGGGETNLTNNAVGDYLPDWSPDGSMIVFQTDRDGSTQIYKMNADGSSPTRVTVSPPGGIEAAWSPDGSKMVFSASRDGDYEIYVMNADGTAQTQLTSNTALDGTPAWQPASYPSPGVLLYMLTTPNPQAPGLFSLFGFSVAVGDVSGDGKADIVVGAPWEAVGGGPGTPPPTYIYQGRVYVFSGADGSLLFTLNKPNPQQAGAYFGNSVAVGDVNNDGKGDIVVGAPYEDVVNQDQGRAYVFSGANGSLLLTLNEPNPEVGTRFGFSLAVLDDGNADGWRDVAVGSPYKDIGVNPDQGQAYVLSGANPIPFRTFTTSSPQANANFGWSMAAGDLNGGGVRDLVVGAPYETVGANPGQGRAYAFDGANGALLLTLDKPNPPQAGAYFGYSVAVGQVDGLGSGDIAVGAPDEDVGGNDAQGRAFVFSGTDGSLLWTLDKPDPPQAGASFGRVAVGDLNSDGKGDIGVGAPYEDVGGKADQGRVYVFSGASGLLIGRTDTPNPQAGANFGWSGAIGDVNGDGEQEGIVGAHGEDVAGKQDQGRVYVYLPGYPPAPAEPEEMTVSLHFNDTILDLNPRDGVPETHLGSATFKGQALFDRHDPQPSGGKETIVTEILSMELHGTLNNFPVIIRAGTQQGLGLSASPGQIQEQIAGTWYPADVWFDVYFQVDDNADIYGVMRNCEEGEPLQPKPVRLRGVTTSLPAMNVEFTVPGDLVEACEDDGTGPLGAGEFVPLRYTMNDFDGTGTSANGTVSVGGIAQLPDTAAELDSVADSPGGSGFSYTVLGAALGVAAAALAVGAWFVRRRWAR